MSWFSYREGFKKVRATLQTDSIDAGLRNRLWNVFKTRYIDPGRNSQAVQSNLKKTCRKWWDNDLKLPLDHAPSSLSSMTATMSKYFFEFEWHELYSFLEIIVDYYPTEGINKTFMKECNDVLESELSAYRFVGGQITKITSDEEILEIEKALETPIKSVTAHLQISLKLLSDKTSPDFRNSIKEAISAVEALCKLIAHDRNATLGQALGRIKDQVGLHGALERAFSALYGYTSSADGIRHALLEEPRLDFEDAKLMLVSCSAFINYLVVKASKAGINLELD